MRRVLVRSLIMAAAAIVTGAITGSATAAQPSTLDRQRAEAAAIFGLRLDALDRVSAQLAGDHDKYESACRGKVTTARTTGIAGFRRRGVWFSQTLAIDNESTPACRLLVTEMKGHAKQITRELQGIDEDARRRGIYPGVMRELKAKYGFE